MTKLEAEVIVVGCGPTGATVGCLLGQLGVNTLIIEQESEISLLPRAGALDGDVLRTWQACGALEDTMTHTLPLAVAFTVGDMTRGGRDILSLAPSMGMHGYPEVSFFYQPFAEARLRQRLSLLDSVKVMSGWEVTAVNTDESVEAATVVARRRADGDLRNLKAKYVLACDGGSSTVRRLVGLAMPGTTYAATRWLVIDARLLPSAVPPVPPTQARDPAEEVLGNIGSASVAAAGGREGETLRARLEREREVSGCRTGLHVPADDAFRFICGPQRPGVQLPLPFGFFRWEFALRADENEARFVTKEHVRILLASRGVNLDDIDVRRQAVYTFHDRLADQWRAGRFLLAGDAAHMLPPFGGQGLTSGVRDAHNVAFKLWLVVRGLASPALLDTYEGERRAHVAGMLRFSRLMASFVLTRSRVVGWLRNAGMRLAWTLHLPVAAMSKRPPSIHGGFVDPAASRWRGIAGWSLPQPLVTPAEGTPVLLDAFLGPGFALVGLDVDPYATVRAQCACRQSRGDAILTVDVTRAGPQRPCLCTWLDQLQTAYVWVVPRREGLHRATVVVTRGPVVAEDTRSRVVWDHTGELLRVAPASSVVVVRPDGMVYGVCDARVPNAAVACLSGMRTQLEQPVPRRNLFVRVVMFLAVLAVLLLFLTRIK